MNRFVKTVLLTGLFVGTTDILAAYLTQWIKTGSFAHDMLNYIAGGLVGLRIAMGGGNAMALLGLFNHYAIATVFTFFFFWIFPKIKILQFNRYLVGMLYAIFINLVMNFIVLPLTPLPLGHYSVADEFINWIMLGVVLGIPVVHSAYRFYNISETLAHE